MTATEKWLGCTYEMCRLLRAKCYGEIPNESWEKVKENWMTPDNIDWLRKHSVIPPFFKPPFVVPPPPVKQS